MMTSRACGDGGRGFQHGFPFFPGFGGQLDGGLGHGLSLWVDQTYHGLSASLSVRRTGEKRKVVLLAFLHRNAVESRICEAATGLRHVEHGVMGIVGMNGLFRGHVKCHALAFHAPCVAAVPALVLVTIGFGVLEIPVLHQFGIQSTVGCIIQVFKEHTNQVLTDGLCPAFVHGNPRTDRLQSGKPGRVMFCTFPALGVEGRTIYAMPFQSFHYAVRHLQCKSRDSLVAHLHGVCHRHTCVFHLMARFLVCHEKLLRFPPYQVC